MLKAFLLLIIAIFAQNSQAAQRAQVNAESAIIYSQPNTSSEVLETKHAGDEIIISNFQKDGWFKAKTNTGNYGWIHHLNVAIGNERIEVKMANLDLMGQKRPDKSRETPPWLFARPSIGGLFTSSATIGGDRFNYTYTTDFLLDLSVRFGFSARGTLRTGYYKTGTDSNRIFSIYRYGIPVMLGAEFLMSKSMDWQTWFNFYGGIDINTFVLENAANSVPKTTSSRKREPFGIASLMFKNSIGSSTRLTLETGLYFSAVSTRTLERVGFLEPLGFPDAIKSHFFGPLLQLGIEFEL